MRAWKEVESFNEYFQNKMILAENVCQEELIDLVIDGIPETDLRNQARMHRFKSPFDLLKAFSMITLRDTRSDRDKRDNRKPLEQCSPANQARHSGELRCFNCNGTKSEGLHIREENGAPVINAEIHSTDLQLVFRMQRPG